MSGLNPFRRRKSTDPPSQQSSSPITTNPSFAESPAASLVTKLSTRNGPHGQRPADDDPASSDGGSMTDPFNADSYSSNRRGGDSPAAPFSNSPEPTSSVTAPSRDRESPTDPGYPETNTAAPTTTAAKSDAFLHSLPSPHPESHTASSSSTDVSDPSSRISAAEHPSAERGMSEMDRDPKTFASRGGKQEKPPPPPPRGRHGKVIGPNPVAASTRLSFHRSSTEASFSRPDAQSSPSIGSGPGGSDENQPIRRAESLQRSHSQYKRPPTPPLSRRQSQLRRSNTTYSQTNPTRHVVKQGDTEASSSLSTDRKSITSSLQESESSTPMSDEAGPRAPSSYEEPISPAASTPENPTGRNSTKGAKRASYTNSLNATTAPPPPPPPRRLRGVSNTSNDSNPISWPQQSTAKEEEEFTPHPSNANGILADLSRLQKEVDDLRGHYEGRKVSQ